MFSLINILLSCLFCKICTSYNIPWSALILDHSTSLDPLTQTGSVDSRLNTDKSVLITLVFVFSGVWHSGWINNLLLSKMYGIQDVNTLSCYFWDLKETLMLFLCKRIRLLWHSINFHWNKGITTFRKY